MGPKVQIGVYLGHTPCYTESVALVLSPKTLHVSPQFHVAFDDDFATVPYLVSSESPPIWKEIVQKSEDVSGKDYDLTKLWMSANTNPEEHLLDQEADVKKSETSNSEGENEQHNSEGVLHKNQDLLLQPTLPDINKFSRRKSRRVVKPSERA